jgi:hypothetical protein
LVHDIRGSDRVHNCGDESHHTICNYVSQNVTEYCSVMLSSPVSYQAYDWLNIGTGKQTVMIKKVSMFWDVIPCGLV